MTEHEALTYAVEVLTGLSLQAAIEGKHSDAQIRKHNEALAVLTEHLESLALTPPR